MKINCPHCRKEYEIDNQFWHQDVTCAECKRDFIAMTDQERAVEEKKRKEHRANTAKKIRKILIIIILLVVGINGGIVGYGYFENRSKTSDAPATGDSSGEEGDSTENSDNGSENLLLAPDDVDYEKFTPTNDAALLKKAYDDLKKLWEETDIFRLGKNLKERPANEAKQFWDDANRIEEEVKKQYGVIITGFSWRYKKRDESAVRARWNEYNRKILLGNNAYQRAIADVHNKRKATVNKFVNKYNSIMQSISCPMLKRSIVNDIYILVIYSGSDAATVLETLIKFDKNLEKYKDNLPELCRLMGRDFFTVPEKENLIKGWFGKNWRKELENIKKREYAATQVYYKDMITRLKEGKDALFENIFKKYVDNFSDGTFADLRKKYNKKNPQAVKDYKRFMQIVSREDTKIAVDYFCSTYNSALSTTKLKLNRMSIEPEFQPVEQERSDSRQLSATEIDTEIERFTGLISEVSKKEIPNLSIMRGVFLYPDKADVQNKNTPPAAKGKNNKK